MDSFAVKDPFADLDDTQRTFVRPNPGGRAEAARTDAATAAPSAAESVAPEHGLDYLFGWKAKRRSTHGVHRFGEVEQAPCGGLLKNCKRRNGQNAVALRLCCRVFIIY